MFIIAKIITALLCGFSIIFTATKIMPNKINKITFVIGVLLISIITFVTHESSYNSEQLLLKIVLCIITLKYVFKISIYQSIITISLVMLVMAISEVLASIVVTNFFSISEARTKWYAVLICNLIVCTLMIIIIKIPFINKAIKKVKDKTDKRNKITTLLLFVISVLMIAYLLYNLSENYKWSEKYFINILLMISYFVIAGIFLKDKLEYDMLEEKYDALFEYFSEIAESIDDLNLTTHEYKNQIAIVGNYIDNKKYTKAKDYIDDISQSINKNEGLLVNLTDIPTGGLKGLLYYKIIVAKNQKVEIVLDVGKNTKKLFKFFSQEHMKIITRIIGVYIDNAVAACKNKIVNIEIYKLDDNLVFTISNKVSNNFDMKKIGKKGFTTKGKGHGQGLYLTNRLIGRNKWLKSENKLVNNYYVTKLIIDTKNIGK